MNCPWCGNLVQQNAQWCKYCGLQLTPGYEQRHYPDRSSGPPPPYAAPAYPPPIYQPPPPKSADKSAAWIIVLVVVLVIAVPFVAAVGWLAISGAVTSTEEQRLTVNLATPSVTHRLISDQHHWDTVLNINKVTPRDEDVLWTDISVAIKSSDGGILLPNTPISPDIGGVYDDGFDGSVDVEVWFIEITTGDNRLSTGDAIKITGMTADFEGGFIQILRSGRIIGDSFLPTDFP